MSRQRSKRINVLKKYLAGCVFQFILTFLILFVTACTLSVRPPDSDETKALQQAEKSLVLLRISADRDGEPWPLHRMSSTERYYLQMASLDAGFGPTFMYKNVTLSEETGEKNWIYFLLSPGTYYMAAAPPDPRMSSGQQAYPNYNFWFYVPTGGRIVYIGSLKTSCTTREGFWGRSLRQCTEPEILNELDEARDIAKQALPGYGSLLHSPLKNYRTASLLTSDSVFPAGVVVNPVRKLQEIHWAKRGVGLATGGVEGSAAAFQAGQAGVLYFMYLPFGILGGAISGGVNASRWETCTQGLEQAVSEFDFSEKIYTKLVQAFSPYGEGVIVPAMRETKPGLAQQLKTFLVFQVLKIQLSECSSRGTFCVDLTGRLQLINASSREVLYDSVLYYAADHTRNVRQFYETSASLSSPCRHMEEYCSDKGKDLFMMQLDLAIQRMAENIAAHISLSK